MLFAYIYVPHQMEKMQKFIDFIFLEVWCKAPIGLAFGPDLFNKKSDLREVLSFFGFAAKAPERGKVFYKNIKSIYQFFAPLPANEIDQLKQWYVGNSIGNAGRRLVCQPIQQRDGTLVKPRIAQIDSCQFLRCPFLAQVVSTENHGTGKRKVSCV